MESHGKYFRDIDYISVRFLLLPAQSSTGPEKHLVGSPFIERGTAMINNHARVTGITAAGALAVGGVIAGANLLGVAHADSASTASCIKAGSTCRSPKAAGRDRRR